jgi:hypothetical protein
VHVLKVGLLGLPFVSNLTYGLLPIAAADGNEEDVRVNDALSRCLGRAYHPRLRQGSKRKRSRDPVTPDLSTGQAIVALSGLLCMKSTTCSSCQAENGVFVAVSGSRFPFSRIQWWKIA